GNCLFQGTASNRGFAPLESPRRKVRMLISSTSLARPAVLAWRAPGRRWRASRPVPPPIEELARRYFELYPRGQGAGRSGQRTLRAERICAGPDGPYAHRQDGPSLRRRHAYKLPTLRAELVQGRGTTSLGFNRQAVILPPRG